MWLSSNLDHGICTLCELFSLVDCGRIEAKGDTNMELLWGFLVFAGTFVVSVFGFCQIIGSIRVAFKQKEMKDFIEYYNGRLISPASTAFTIIFWLTILVLACLAVHSWLNDYRIPYYIATGLTFLLSLKSGSTINDVAEATHMQMPEGQADINENNS